MYLEEAPLPSAAIEFEEAWSLGLAEPGQLTSSQLWRQWWGQRTLGAGKLNSI